MRLFDATTRPTDQTRLDGVQRGTVGRLRPVCLFLAVGVVIMIFLAGGAPDAAAQDGGNVTEITDCTQINDSGTYHLASDIRPDEPENWNSSQACILISSGNVTLDGMGHTINGSPVSDENDNVSVAFTEGIAIDNRSGTDAGSGGWLADVTVTNVTLAYWDTAIDVWGVRDAVTRDIEITHTDGLRSFDYQYASNVTVSDIRANEEIDEGRFLQIDEASDITITGAVIEPDARFGNSVIRVIDSSNVEITDNTIDESAAGSGRPAFQHHGIRVLNTSSAIVRNNTLRQMDGGDDPTYGIQLARNGENPNAVITDNDLTNVDRGMELIYADNATVSRNTLENTFRLYLRDSVGATIADNHRLEGVTLDGTTGTLIESNSLVEQGIQSDGGITSEGVAPEAIRNNTVLGAPRGIIVDATDRSADGLVIEGNEIDGDGSTDSSFESGGGITVIETDRTKILNNSVTDTGEIGIQIEGGTGHRLWNASITGLKSDSSFSDGGFPIRLDSVENTTISGVSASDNPELDDENDVVDSTNVTIEDSEFVDSNDGFDIVGSSGISIERTTIANNDNPSGQITVDGDSTNITGTNVSIGASTAPGTTLSFEARGVDIGTADSPPENPDATSIDRYVDAENRTATGYLDLTIRYEDTDVTDVDESTLAIWNYDGSAWSKVTGSAVDTDAGTVSVNVTRFSILGVFGTESSEPAPIAVEHTRFWRSSVQTTEGGEAYTSSFLGLEAVREDPTEAETFAFGSGVDRAVEIRQPDTGNNITVTPSGGEGTYDVNRVELSLYDGRGDLSDASTITLSRPDADDVEMNVTLQGDEEIFAGLNATFASFELALIERGKTVGTTDERFIGIDYRGSIQQANTTDEITLTLERDSEVEADWYVEFALRGADVSTPVEHSEGDDVFEATINVSGVEPGNYTGSFEMYPAEDHDRNEQILEVSDDDGIAVEGDETETTPTPTPTPTPEPTLTPTSTPTTTPTGTPTVTRTGTSNGLVDAEADGFGVVIVVLALVVLVMYSRRRNK